MAIGCGEVVPCKKFLPCGFGIEVARFELLKNADRTWSQLNAFQPGISDCRSDCLAGRVYGRSHEFTLPGPGAVLAPGHAQLWRSALKTAAL